MIRGGGGLILRGQVVNIGSCTYEYVVYWHCKFRIGRSKTDNMLIKMELKAFLTQVYRPSRSPKTLSCTHGKRQSPLVSQSWLPCLREFNDKPMLATKLFSWFQVPLNPLERKNRNLRILTNHTELRFEDVWEKPWNTFTCLWIM